jgi:uncharacterized membrane protein YfcA
MTVASGLSVALVLQAGLAVFSAAVLRGFTGFGFAIAAVPLLALILPPANAIILVLLLQFVAGLFDFPSASKTCHWVSLRWLAAGALLGSPLGLIVLTAIPASSGRFAIAALTLVSLLLLANRQAPRVFTGPGSSLPFGLAAGIFNGLAAMPGPPVIVYYLAIGVPSAVARASMLVFFFFTAAVGLATSLSLELVSLDSVLLATLVLPALWCGSLIGAHWFSVGSEAYYRRIALGCLAVLAIISGLAAVGDMLTH